MQKAGQTSAAAASLDTFAFRSAFSAIARDASAWARAAAASCSLTFVTVVWCAHGYIQVCIYAFVLKVVVEVGKFRKSTRVPMRMHKNLWPTKNKKTHEGFVQIREVGQDLRLEPQALRSHDRHVPEDERVLSRF